jgi:hypothetical protein
MSGKIDHLGSIVAQKKFNFPHWGLKGEIFHVIDQLA